MIFQKNDALLKEIEQLKEQYVIKFQEVSGKIDKCRYKVCFLCGVMQFVSMWMMCSVLNEKYSKAFSCLAVFKNFLEVKNSHEYKLQLNCQ